MPIQGPTPKTMYEDNLVELRSRKSIWARLPGWVVKFLWAGAVIAALAWALWRI